jgi:putative transposase
MRAKGFAVESVCEILREQGCQIAARTYRAAKLPGTPAPRTVSDALVLNALKATAGRPESLYGRRKMTAHLRRQGLSVAACTVDRLMRQEGMNGVVRGRSARTTIPGKDGRRAGDLLNRDFHAATPNRVWVADFTYVPTWAGFVYVAFAVDVFAQAIVGWHAMTSKHTDLVLTCLRTATWRRSHEGHRIDRGLIHHSDAGSQYTSVRFTDHLAADGFAPSIGTVGDAYDNALMETIIGLYKTEAIGTGLFHDKPLRTLADVEHTTLGWVEWYNTRRLHSALDYATPAEREARHYAATEQAPLAATHQTGRR